MFRTVGDQPSLWESILPEEVRRLPDELARVDALLDDPAFFTPFVPFFDLRMVASEIWCKSEGEGSGFGG
ncbi:transposase [Mycobacteroides abscessus subsp. abscessus]|uniref:Transposase n=1 Tax=Mycobacterium intracellulare subsp. chimaera TaxID=222805 RepID=A0A7U5MK33_MYCIT|nr:transposase [Mycobacterium intracellulare subsp. yongonense 05-1390]ARR77772.1 IS1560, transposase [Mycobacterium intracellulare subsp. yongonense]ASL14977.1 transposase [Mycobacterium intracellulare subsp. chimaera]KEF96268.1 transposase [Mycobacterium sp. TKK-01-0059]SHY36457.1 transposase [Mycobacteroides abscessus subsp. abscessus]